VRLIIAGGRDFNNFKLLSKETLEFIGDNTPENTTIISGLAKGADTLGCEFARKYGFELRGFAAEWNKFGRSAGIMRNKLMAKNADSLIAFWDGKSKGTMHMIDYAYSLNLNIKVVHYG
jgi:hypothetical protein